MQFTKNESDAEEIINDSFLAIWEKRDELSLDDSLKSYLYTIVKNKSLNLLKKRKVEFEDIEAQYDYASPQYSVVHQIQAKETEKIIFELIEKLPNKCKQIFVLSRKEFLPNKEIAKILEITEKTVENQISIAIKFIKQGLEIKNNLNGTTSSRIVVFPWLLAYILLGQ